MDLTRLKLNDIVHNKDFSSELWFNRGFKNIEIYLNTQETKDRTLILEMPFFNGREKMTFEKVNSVLKIFGFYITREDFENDRKNS